MSGKVLPKRTSGSSVRRVWRPSHSPKAGAIASISNNASTKIEEIARPFGVPRPLLGVDDTSWGSGIDSLGQLFVRFALNPHFEAWQQAIERCLLDDEEAEIYEAKFNVAALLNGSIKDQGEYFAKALGSGGHQPWMDYAEVRETVDLPERDLAANPLAQSKT